MKKLTALLLSLCLLLVTLTAPAAMAEAAEPAAQQSETGASQQIRVFLFSEPQAIKLPKAETSYWFMVPAQTVVNGASLQLEMETTEILLGDYSTVTLCFNGVNVASANLAELRDRHGSVWKVEIPAERVKTDGSLNELKLITAQRTILGDCADIDNPANWLLLKQTSALVLDVASFGPSTLATLMDNMFNRVDGADTLAAEFVLNGSALQAEKSAMLSMASAIGAANPYKGKVLMPVSVGGARTGLRNRLMVSASPLEGVSVQADNGYLRVTEADGSTVLYVMGSGAKGLEKAMRMVLYSGYLQQLSGTQREISSTVTHSVAELPLNAANMYTLHDYGYDDISLAGAFHQQTNFQVRQPEGMVSGPDSYFEVHFRHSDALVSDTSLLTVYFNNVAASSIQLSGMNTENGTLRVKIPQEAMQTAVLSVTVDVYNYLGKIDCSKDWYDVAWTVIDDDSVFYFQPGTAVVPPSLNNFPFFPATSAAMEHETVFFLPQASETLLTASAELACRAGQQIRSGVNIHAVDLLNKDVAQHADIVAMGPADALQLPEEIASKLYVTYDKGAFQVSDKLDTIAEALEDRIILQAIQSPYDSSRVAYVIMWAPGVTDQEVLALLRSRQFVNGLKGQVAFASPVGSAEASVLADAKTVAPASQVTLTATNVELKGRPVTIDSVVNTAVNYTGISRMGLLLILILLIVLIICIVRSIRVKNRFVKARGKVEATNKKGNPKAPKPEPAAEEPEADDEDFDH